MDLLKKYPKDEGLQWQGIACMANLLSQNTDKNKIDAEQLGLIQAVTDALMAHKASKMVQAEGLRCLMNCCNSNIANEDRAAAHGAFNHAVAAMQMFPDVAEVNEMGARLILALVWSRMANRAMAVQAGADKQLQVVVSSFTPQKDQNKVADWATAALNKIATAAS